MIKNNTDHTTLWYIVCVYTVQSQGKDRERAREKERKRVHTRLAFSFSLLLRGTCSDTWSTTELALVFLMSNTCVRVEVLAFLAMAFELPCTTASGCMVTLMAWSAPREMVKSSLGDTLGRVDCRWIDRYKIDTYM